MAKHDHLMKRKGVWYYRRRVPNDLIDHFGMKVVQFSLKTKDEHEALIGRAKADLEWDAKFKIAREILAGTVKPDEPLAYDAALERIARYVADRDRDLSERHMLALGEINTAQRMENVATNQTHLYDLKHLTDEGISDISARWASLFGHTLDHLPKEQRAHVFDFLRRAEMELVQRVLARDRSDFSQPHFDHVFSGAGSISVGSAGQKGTMTMGQLASAYLANYKTESAAQGVSQLRIDSVDRHVAIILEVVGKSTPVDAITYDRCLEIRNTLATVPTNKAKIYPKLTLAAAIERGAKQGRRTIGRERQKVYLDTLGAILAHGMKLGAITSNPAVGIKPLGKQTAPEDKRHPFTTGQLQAIFNAPLYTGCLDDRMRFAKPGPNVIRRARFWIPLICLFHGMRPGEVCQMYPSDVRRTTKGTWYFDVSNAGEDQSLKTPSSRRAFPMHPELIKMGFADYVTAKKQEGAPRLFPELKPNKYGKYSPKFCDWFSETFLPKYVEKKAGLTFYSFRHNFRDALRRMNAGPELLQRLGGWSQSGTVDANYGSGDEIDDLAVHVEKISYPGLDLSHLYID